MERQVIMLTNIIPLSNNSLIMEYTDLVILGELRAYLEENGIKHTDVADAIGIKQSHFSKLLSGTIKMKINELIKIQKETGFVPKGLTQQSDQKIRNLKHQNLVGKFRNKPLAYKINEVLLEIEETDPKSLQMAYDLVNVLSQNIRAKGDRRKNDDGPVPDTGDRRAK